MKIKLMESKTPKIMIGNYAMAKMREYIDGINKEIGWLGTVVREGLQFYIDDVFLFKQEVHSTTTEITPEGLNEFAMELMSTENGMDIWNDMKLWGHSHVNMGVNPSLQDDEQIKTFESCGYDFFIRIICNKKGDVRLDLYDYESGIIYQELPYTIYYSAEEEEYRKEITSKIALLQQALKASSSLANKEKEDIKTEISQKVKEKTYFTGYNKSGFANNNYASWWDDYKCDNYGYVKKNTNEIKEVSVISDEELADVDFIFDTMSQPEVFEAYEHIDVGGKIKDICMYELTDAQYNELEELILEYTYAKFTDYQEYTIEREED